MNHVFQTMVLEIAVLALAIGVLLLDLWTPPAKRRLLGYLAAIGLSIIFAGSFFIPAASATSPALAFDNMFVVDHFALFFKRFFIAAAVLVILIAIEFSDRIESAVSEFYSLILFALAGMLFAASANDFIMMFVSLELITVTFYILISFQRSKQASLEAGVKYLILGALSTAFLVYGMALVFGTMGTTNFAAMTAATKVASEQPVFLLGLLLILVGLGFKIAAFPFQIWAPDVYQGSPAPITAFLAVGSKAAGFVLLLRMLYSAVPEIAAQWNQLLIVMSAVTILYGNLCAIPQRNLKRLLGYSSVANAGYMLLGVAALSEAGSSAVLYYLAGYLFTVIAAFAVITVVTRDAHSEDVSVLAGLNHRSPLLAATLTLSMVSLAGIPPLAGFFGKFLLVKAVVERGETNSAYYILAGVAVVGVVISLFYYLGVVRAIYWSKDAAELLPITITPRMRITVLVCVAGMLFLGVFPQRGLEQTNRAAHQIAISNPMGVATATPAPVAAH